jgi:hypothetical protein
VPFEGPAPLWPKGSKGRAPGSSVSSGPLLAPDGTDHPNRCRGGGAAPTLPSSKDEPQGARSWTVNGVSDQTRETAAAAAKDGEPDTMLLLIKCKMHAL